METGLELGSLLCGSPQGGMDLDLLTLVKQERGASWLFYSFVFFKENLNTCCHQEIPYRSFKSKFPFENIFNPSEHKLLEDMHSDHLSPTFIFFSKLMMCPLLWTSCNPFTNYDDKLKLFFTINRITKNQRFKPFSMFIMDYSAAKNEEQKSSKWLFLFNTVHWMDVRWLPDVHWSGWCETKASNASI